MVSSDDVRMGLFSWELSHDTPPLEQIFIFHPWQDLMLGHVTFAISLALYQPDRAFNSTIYLLYLSIGIRVLYCR